MLIFAKKKKNALEGLGLGIFSESETTYVCVLTYQISRFLSFRHDSTSFRRVNFTSPSPHLKTNP